MNKSALPATTMIRGKKWRVRWAHRGELSTPMKPPNHGICDWDTKEILMRKNAELAETLFHEHLHAVYPDLSEEAIIEGEKAMMEALRILEKLRDPKKSR